MPQGVSIRAFADLDGCSHTAVQNGLRRGQLKAFSDGTLDPKLAKTAWRPGNWREVRGGKPRKAPRQLAGNSGDSGGVGGELPQKPATAAGVKGESWGDLAACHRFEIGLLSGLVDLGRHAPARAAEIAGRHDLPAEALNAYFEEVRADTKARIDALVAEYKVPREIVAGYYDPEDGGALLPPDDFRCPGETEDAMWSRIVP